MAKKCVLIFNLLFLMNFIYSQNEVFVKTGTIKYSDIYDSSYYGGRIEPLNTIVQYSSISGIINNIYVVEGQRVVKGTHICSIRRKLSSESYQPAVVTAVSSGLVVNMKIFNQMEVFEKSELFSIADDRKYKVDILISDKDILNVKLYDECYIKDFLSENESKEMDKENHNKKENEIKGKVNKIAILPGDNKGLFNAEIVFDKTNDLFIGKFVTLELRTNKRNAIAVPQGSILKKYGKLFIYIVQSDNTIKLREVKIGQNFGESVEILSGVKENEIYIIQPSAGMIEGDKVNIKKQ
ncbi:MAG: HlyD family efflux transporter periplasmic adaptor subunit [Spirochaetes bacterium]|nr:HlyD family efflux transporter periplasmic adaptor subunit [Spirochaetota bacterium]